MTAALGRLKDIDVDGDGSADLKEVLSFLLAEGYDAPFAHSLMAALDTDGDGQISEDEWKEGVLKLMQKDEFASAIEGATTTRRHEPEPKPKPKPQPEPSTPDTQPEPKPKPKLQKLDS